MFERKGAPFSRRPLSIKNHERDLADKKERLAMSYSLLHVIVLPPKSNVPRALDTHPRSFTTSSYHLDSECVPLPILPNPDTYILADLLDSLDSP